MELAEENCSYTFLGTKCVQKYLDRKWFGNIKPYVNSKNTNSLLVNHISNTFK
jgi:hypothetical protein